jgi:hypothetical protein
VAALGEEVVGRRGARGRRRGGGPPEKGWRPSGRRRRSTGRRGWALTDDGGVLVEVGRALLEEAGWSEGRRRSGGTLFCTLYFKFVHVSINLLFLTIICHLKKIYRIRQI